MKRAILIVVVLAAIAAGAYAFWRFRNQSRANLANNFQTVPAQRGDLGPASARPARCGPTRLRHSPGRLRAASSW
jgi:hypothetical protein